MKKEKQKNLENLNTDKTEHIKQPIEIPFLKSPIFGYLLVFLGFLLVLGGFLLIFANAQNEGVIGTDCIGELEIKGEIVSYDVTPSLFGTDSLVSSEKIKEQIEQAQKRDDIKALLVVIDSPGGSVVGSQEIYRALKNFKKPKVAYFREIAASGGYYAALGTDYIVAEPNSITGSIGARMTLAELTGLFEKLGYNQTNIKSGELKDIGDPSKKATEKEIEILQKIVNETFEDFKGVLLENRQNKLNKDYLEDIYKASIFTGKQAYKAGLVDKVGSKEDAIKKTMELANLKEKNICKLQEKKQSFLSSLLAEAIGPINPKIEINIQLPKESSNFAYK
jgi:protease-4